MIDFEKHRYKIEKILNILGAFIYVVFAATCVKSIIHYHQLNSIFPLILTTFFAYFFLTRDLPQQLNLSPYDWLITLNGTFLPMCLRPAPPYHDSPVFLTLQILGTCISIVGLISLNKSIGLAPANRGIKTFWAYRYVRHPIYAGYFITFGAFSAQNLTVGNFIITMMWMVCEVLRMFAEEKYLSRDPAYADYMQKVRWRMFPHIF